MILQLQSTCLWTRVGFWTTEIQNTHGRRSFISRKSGLRAVVMWSCEPFRFQSFAPVSEMNNRTLSPLPGHPLICLHFYSSHQFPEATLTSSKVMAEHLCFKTFRMSTRCLYEKKYHIHWYIQQHRSVWEEVAECMWETVWKGLTLSEDFFTTIRYWSQ